MVFSGNNSGVTNRGILATILYAIILTAGLSSCQLDRNVQAPGGFASPITSIRSGQERLKMNYDAGNWVATDALGRELPTYQETGPRRDGKWVGMFYYIWHSSHGDSIWDITKILAENPDHPRWGPKGAYHFWGEPEQGYHNSEDPWVIRRDLQMLSNADIDFLFFDVTNANAYIHVVNEVCKVSLQMRKEGIQTPELCFLTNSRSGRIINQVYDELYSNATYKELWFRWDGKPLIMGIREDPELRAEVRDFFTIRKSWAWTNAREEPDHWQWLDKYSQDYGWSIGPEIPEQITVSTAHHPQNPLGKSYHDGAQPPVLEDYTTEFTDQGLQFEEQWSRAHEVDPQVVMVTQWNEWIAGRFEWQQEDGTYAGKPIKKGEWRHFVDVFTREFNRDIAPMKGGYTDNYYYQLVDHVRRFKGMDPQQQSSGPKTIFIDGKYSEWSDVFPVFRDPPGDVMHRDFKGYDPDIAYVNRTGRNDIIESRVTLDEEMIYFYVKTGNDLTPFNDPNWMLLFLDIDKDKSTGWVGYDYVINHGEVGKSRTTLKKWNGSEWKKRGTVRYATHGNGLELGFSRKKIGLEGKPLDFYFHWSDNSQHLEDITDFFLNGDSAPDRRFNYHFKTNKSD
jgi:hypothetical protein